MITAKHSKAWLVPPYLLICLVFSIAFYCLKATAAYRLYTEEFTNDLAVWNLKGTWQVTNGALVTTESGSSAWMGRRDWRNYVIDARVTMSAPSQQSYFRISGRRQQNGDSFALELTLNEIRLVLVTGEQSQVLARTPITLTQNEPHLIRLGLHETTMTGQIDNLVTLSADIGAYNSSRTAGQIGLMVSGVSISIDTMEVVYMDSPTMPRSNLAPPPGYLPAGTSRSAGAKDIMLIYSGHYASGAGVWDIADAIPYLAYSKNNAGTLEVKDWFFDTFLFLGLQAPSGRAFDSPQRATPSTLTDWQWYLDNIFQEKKQLGAFNTALEYLKLQLADPGYRAKIIIMIPHPTPLQRNFGDVDGDGVSEGFSPQLRGMAAAEDARWKAVKWYVDEVERRWQQAGYTNLDLIGYYWLDEHLGPSNGITPDLLSLRTSDYIHGQNRKLFWIPYFRAERYEMAYRCGFDSVIMQPNYMFNPGIAVTRFADFVHTVQHEQFGVEIEADETVLSSATGRERYLNYLRAGVTYGYMKGAVHAYYQGAKVLLSAFASRDTDVRGIYDATYEFVKGTFSEQLH